MQQSATQPIDSTFELVRPSFVDDIKMVHQSFWFGFVVGTLGGLLLGLILSKILRSKPAYVQEEPERNPGQRARSKSPQRRPRNQSRSRGNSQTRDRSVLKDVVVTIHPHSGDAQTRRIPPQPARRGPGSEIGAKSVPSSGPKTNSAGSSVPRGPMTLMESCSQHSPCPCCNATRVFFGPFRSQFPAQKNHMDLIRMIEKAESSIRICMFRLTYFQIIKKLIELHSKKRVTISVITDSGFTKKKSDISDESRNHLTHVKILLDAGICVKTTQESYKREGSMHSKFAIIDERDLINGSMNWTYPGFHFNNEHAVLMRSRKIIEEFKSYFDHLWFNCPKIEIPENL